MVWRRRRSGFCGRPELGWISTGSNAETLRSQRGESATEGDARTAPTVEINAETRRPLRNAEMSRPVHNCFAKCSNILLCVSPRSPRLCVEAELLENVDRSLRAISAIAVRRGAEFGKQISPHSWSASLPSSPRFSATSAPLPLRSIPLSKCRGRAQSPFNTSTICRSRP